MNAFGNENWEIIYGIAFRASPIKDDAPRNTVAEEENDRLFEETSLMRV